MNTDSTPSLTSSAPVCDECATDLHEVGGTAHPYWTCQHCGGAVALGTAA